MNLKLHIINVQAIDVLEIALHLLSYFRIGALYKYDSVCLVMHSNIFFFVNWTIL